MSKRHFEIFSGGRSLEASRRAEGFREWRAVSPSCALFCADRAWDQKTESVRFKAIEDRAHKAFTIALDGGEVEDHEAVSLYLLLWEFRGRVQSSPMPDAQLAGVAGSRLTKDEQEVLETNGVLFVREDRTVPGRFSAGFEWMKYLDSQRSRIAGSRWRLACVSGGSLHLGDRPNRSLLPVTPERAFVPEAVSGTVPAAAANWFSMDLARTWLARAVAKAAPP